MPRTYTPVGPGPIVTNTKCVWCGKWARESWRRIEVPPHCNRGTCMARSDSIAWMERPKIYRRQCNACENDYIGTGRLLCGKCRGGDREDSFQASVVNTNFDRYEAWQKEHEKFQMTLPPKLRAPLIAPGQPSHYYDLQHGEDSMPAKANSCES